MQKFDGVFNGNDVIGARDVDPVDQGGQSGALAAAGRAGDQDHAPLLLSELVHNFGQFQLFDGLHLGGNQANRHANVAPLLEHVHTKSAQPGDTVSHIQVGRFLELLLLPIVHHAEGHTQHDFARDAGKLVEGFQLTLRADVRVVPYF